MPSVTVGAVLGFALNDAQTRASWSADAPATTSTSPRTSGIWGRAAFTYNHVSAGTGGGSFNDHD